MIAMEAHGRINAIKYFFRVLPWQLNKSGVQLKLVQHTLLSV
jgi:hypothetical protein